MKKHIIAAAVAAAVAVPAMAQVTVSGRVDTSVFNQKAFETATTTASSTTVNQKALTTNQLVFSASEDLGGGLKANFVLATEFASDVPAGASSILGSRGAVVGVSGGFGRIDIGRLTGNFMDGLSVGGTTGNLSGGGGFGLTMINSKPMNAVQYSTPSLGGVMARVIKSYNAAASEVASKDDEQTEVMLSYSQGPLSIQAAQTNHKRVDIAIRVATTGIAGAALTNVDVTEKGLMVKYNAGFAAFTVRYFDQEHPAANATTHDNSSTAIGASIPLGNGLTLNADYRTIDFESGATNGFDTTRIGVVLVKDLSKRTNVYVAAYEDDHTAKPATSGFGVGVRHNF